ncbi:MAG: glycosyltransferase family 2 protein [bacterium]
MIYNEITLAICAYNAQLYIEETLRCILKQSFQQFDLWIVNDCSTDNTVSIVQNTLDSADREYKIINFDTNKGLAAARAYVEQNAKTKYIIFVDADDCPLPTLVEKLYNTISNDGDLMAVGCYQKFIDENSKKIAGGMFLGAKTKEEFYHKAQNQKLIFMQPTAIIDREVVLSVGGRNISGFPDGKPRYQDLCEDLDLWCRMSDLYTEGKAIVVVPEVLMFYRKHSASMSASNINMQLRMRHIKTNLKRRRIGEPELSFVEFMETVTPEQISALERENVVVTSLREGVIFFRRGRMFKGSSLIIKSIFMNPSYFWQKIVANSGFFR